MNIRAKIIDYVENKTEVEKWLFVKGEDKYSFFVNKLEEMKQVVTWKNLSDLYRYDKRLLFNNFNYLSFFEEYLRAALIRENIGLYEKMTKKLFSALIEDVENMNDEKLQKYFDCLDPMDKLSKLNSLRRNVCHSKIIIELDYKESIRSFYALLPAAYRDCYKKAIIGCTKELNIFPEISTIF